MKKIILLLIFTVSFVSALTAQADSKAIGLRLGYGAELSYQQPFGNANRLELDLGLNYWGFGLSGVYQWVWNLSESSPGFKWYAGVGAGLGSYHYSSTINSLGIGILGQIGIEYNFNIPLQLSLDYRPGIYIIPAFWGSYDGICLSARYRF
jgi:hypothetical protein